MNGDPARRSLVVAAIAVTLALGLALGLVVAQPGSSQSSPEAAVLKVAKAGRTAVLRDRPAAVCRLLTRRARRNSLLAGNYVDQRAEQKRPRPNTCENAVRFLIENEFSGRDFKAVKRRPSLASLTVVRIRGKRAHVRLSIPAGDGYTTDADIYLLKGERGWRADFANFSPFDGSSGR